MRWTTCLTLFSPWCLSPKSPALRKYLLMTMSVASWLQPAGISAPSILKTIDPSGFVITLERRSYTTASRGSMPGLVSLRATAIPAATRPEGAWAEGAWAVGVWELVRPGGGDDF